MPIPLASSAPPRAATTTGAIETAPVASTRAGWLDGFVGMAIFSASLPATRVAIRGFDPVFLTAARAVVAGLIGLVALLSLRERRPRRADLGPLAVVAGGVVVGFPLLTALALRHLTSAQALVFVALLPLSTAIFAAWRGGERPSRAFWLFAVAGAATVAAYALLHRSTGPTTHGSTVTSSRDAWIGDGAMAAAILVCGLAYAEGARLSRRLGGWQVISWALVLALPAMLALALATAPSAWSGIGAPAWIGFGYVSIFSMWVGFVFWYRGLAAGGAATVGQLQLLQPFLGLALAATLLHETVDATMVLVAGVAVLCVAGVRRFAGRPPIRPA